MQDAGMSAFKNEILEGIPSDLPPPQKPNPQFDHAPQRQLSLSPADQCLAIENALRYFPQSWHSTLAKEFKSELQTSGRITMYRFKPKHPIKARPISDYPCKCPSAAAIMLMIQNNLDPEVAQYPDELITYGGNGAVFQNWAQYRLTMKYLSKMNENQTLVMYSGHPLGLFPSHSRAPRVTVTNGMMIPNYSSRENYDRLNAIGVTQFGQMTAGSYMYIGPQGIVHGTLITILNAGRKLSPNSKSPLAGKLFVSAGLGGMSGAQPKAGAIAGAVALIAEINPLAAKKRHAQGWVDELENDLDKAIDRALEAKEAKQGLSIAYVGNVVDLWCRLVERGIHVELGSDQTSLHAPFTGGYYPQGLDFQSAQTMMAKDPEAFKDKVYASLRTQMSAIEALAKKGMYFFDYGNALLLESSRAGADVMDHEGKFKFPSYVQDIMGPLCFDYGFGPFRWVCASGALSDLKKTDALAAEVLKKLISAASDEIQPQLIDNLKWIQAADENQLVVGSKARILYAHAQGRIEIARAFNRAIRTGHLEGPVILGRDHHDVSGTDSPFRETSNIYDGSALTADMAVQNVMGDAFRGATWVSLHNGGGVGWGEVINGGFGLVLDGSDVADENLNQMLHWDVNNGIARRCWARNPHARWAIEKAMEENTNLTVTLPETVDSSIFD